MTHHEALEREAYLKKTMEENPDYAEILPLFIAICEHVRENPGTGGAAFAVSPDAESRVRSGVPALTVENLEVNGSAALTFLQSLADRLLAVGIGETAQFRNFRYLSESELPKLLQAWFKGQRGPIQSTAFRLRVNPGVLESLLAVPVKEAAVDAATAVPADWYQEWESLTCPVCGSEPTMAQLGEDGKRSLSCGVCRTEWRFRRIACAYCGNDDPEKLSHIAVEGDSVRVDVCCKCGRYLKTHDTRTSGITIPLDLLDVTTMHLDLLAERHGFSRE